MKQGWMSRLFWRHSVCQECGVHFEPVTADLARWGHLCAEHRKESMEEARRKRYVAEWAEVNWRRLEDMMKAEREESQARNSAMMQSAMGRMEANHYVGQQQSQLRNPFNRGFGGYQ